MSVVAVNNTSNTYEDTPLFREADQQLDRDAFLNLLITQIQHQDPMEPMQDREFIAQLAQFSSLEQMQLMNQNMSLMALQNAGTYATSLVGREITALQPGVDTPLTGTVTSVSYETGSPLLQVGDTLVDPSWVIKIA